MPTTIGLLSPAIGNGNLGDEATVAAVIQSLTRRHPTAVVYAFSPNPDDTRERHHIPAFPITRRGRQQMQGRATQLAIKGRSHILRQKVKTVLKALRPIYTVLKMIHAVPRLMLELLGEIKFLATSFQHLRGTDLLIVTGSGVLSDHFGGPFNFPYTLFKWSLLAKAVRTRLAFVSMGAGPLQSRLSRWLIKCSLSLACYRSSRDATSKHVLDSLGVPGTTPIYPDLAASLRVNPVHTETVSGQTVVAINAFPHFDSRYWPVGNPQRYEQYVTAIAEFTSWLIEHDYRVLLFPTQLRADPPVINDIKTLVYEHLGRRSTTSFMELPMRNLSDLLSGLSLADLVVATRFHGIVLSFLLRKPVLAIANHHKMRDLMSDVGQSAYLLDADSVTPASLIECFTRVEVNRDAISQQITERVSAYRHALEVQYDRVVGSSRIAPPSVSGHAQLETQAVP